MKLKSLINGIDSFRTLLNEKYSLKVGFKLGSISQKINPILASFDDSRNKMIEELGEEVMSELGEPTGKYEIKTKEGIEKFSKEMNDLLEEDVDVEISKIKIEELGDIKMSAIDVNNLEWLFDKE